MIKKYYLALISLLIACSGVVEGGIIFASDYSRKDGSNVVYVLNKSGYDIEVTLESAVSSGVASSLYYRDNVLFTEVVEGDGVAGSSNVLHLGDGCFPADSGLFESWVVPSVFIGGVICLYKGVSTWILGAEVAAFIMAHVERGVFYSYGPVSGTKVVFRNLGESVGGEGKGVGMLSKKPSPYVNKEAFYIMGDDGYPDARQDFEDAGIVVEASWMNRGLPDSDHKTAGWAFIIERYEADEEEVISDDDTYRY